MESEFTSQPRIETVRRGRWFYFGSGAGFEWTRVELPIADLPAGLVGMRICHLTDLHVRFKWCRSYDDLIARLAAAPPDVILCTGDFVEHRWRHRKSVPILRRLLDSLPSRLGTWGILGNHDGDLLLPHLVDCRLHLLNRARTLIDRGADKLELIGLPGVHRMDLDEEFVRTIPPRQRGRLRIVMQHYPDQIRQTESLNAELVLAGHTHGGQVALPGGIPIITHDRLPRRYSQGIHRFGSSWLVIGRGFGFAALPVRTFAAPQVIEISLVNTNAKS